MKTVKQIADEIGVTKAALQKRIGRGSLYTRLSPYISTQNGTKYIDEMGENIIKETFKEKPSIPRVDTTGIDNSIDGEIDGSTRILPSATDNMLVEILHKQMEVLNQQLSIKDKQIEEQQQTINGLNETIRIQAESINAANKNTLAETIIDNQEKLSVPALQKEKGSLWSKLFKIRKKYSK
jgi:hypothetical protein